MDETDAGDANSGTGTLCTGVVTIASSRELATDEAGEVIGTVLDENGNEITVREHVGADYDRVQSIVSRLVERDDVDVVVTAGSTGVEPSDVTIEAVEPILEKELTTFSELFAVVAYERIGTAVVATRTLAGIAERTPVFCLPGDPDAVRLALEEIIVSEAAQLVDRARRDESASDDDSDAEANDTTDADDSIDVSSGN
ncbi:molybdenum cofactor biosynthesis protein B [Haloarchaeobius amylolyticus]|uniref:Molybdenum cofactor biosynthesis protein B n=1 Tax=Haloarchaeobius amylolyticus TaxID=1198296 RepID=A0ABD6BKV3_9EURY